MPIPDYRYFIVLSLAQHGYPRLRSKERANAGRQPWLAFEDEQCDTFQLLRGMESKIKEGDISSPIKNGEEH